MDTASNNQPVDVSDLLPIPQYVTYWTGDYYRCVHRDDGSVISAATYREAVIRCFAERTRRAGIPLATGGYLIGLGNDYLSGPMGS